MKTIKGKIIRIVDKRTVIINLGKEHGVKYDAIFSIMGEPEQIIDPDSKYVLGEVKIVKSRVKAKEVADKFTIATTQWVEVRNQLFSKVFNRLNEGFERTEIDEGELFVDEKDLKPWKAKSEFPVRVGDLVQVEIEEKDTVEKATIKEGKTNSEKE
jgi:hypothetical protein